MGVVMEWANCSDNENFYFWYCMCIESVVWNRCMGDFYFLRRNPIFLKKNHQGYSLGFFQKWGFRYMKRNQTVSCQIVRLYLLNLHTKDCSHSVFIYTLKQWICMCSFE